VAHCDVRLAKTVQKGTENCPDKAKKMQLKLNKMDAPFKQVLALLLNSTMLEPIAVHRRRNWGQSPLLVSDTVGEGNISPLQVFSTKII